MADHETPQEFSDFEKLTAQLLAVSKEDLDAQRKVNKDAPTSGVPEIGQPRLN
jgi:hypothetical protein